jgi:hypothetical protein
MARERNCDKKNNCMILKVTNMNLEQVFVLVDALWIIY